MGNDGAARRGKITQEDIANACKIDQGSVSRILNKDTRDSFAPETVDRVFKIARELGYLHPALVTSNRRESIRRKAGFEARVQIIVGTNTVYDEGGVDVEEVSNSGMLLRNFRTKKRSLPMDRFKLDVELSSPKTKSLRVRCRVVRFWDNENEFGLAVRFEGLDDSARERLKAYSK
ncbi:MAG TPA: PilZ domain-containing protein [Planctomycetota bacterium]|nr:PilZ domain-containing protein [Planctomycetota bacterium]